MVRDIIRIPTKDMQKDFCIGQYILQNSPLHWSIRISAQGGSQWIEGLPAVILAGLPAMFVEGWTEFIGEEVVVARLKT